MFLSGDGDEDICDDDERECGCEWDVVKDVSGVLRLRVEEFVLRGGDVGAV